MAWRRWLAMTKRRAPNRSTSAPVSGVSGKVRTMAMVKTTPIAGSGKRATTWT